MVSTEASPKQLMLWLKISLAITTYLSLTSTLEASETAASSHSQSEAAMISPTSSQLQDSIQALPLSFPSKSATQSEPALNPTVAPTISQASKSVHSVEKSESSNSSFDSPSSKDSPLPNNNSITPQQPNSPNLNNNVTPSDNNKEYAIWVSIFALIVSASNLFWTRRAFGINSRKSIYDDFWFREIFFKKLMSEIIDFRRKWTTKKCREMMDAAENDLLEDFLSDLATLRDIAASIEVLNKGAVQSFNEAIDKLEEIPTSDDPEIMYTEAVKAITSKAFEIHKSMEKSKYKFV